MQSISGNFRASWMRSFSPRRAGCKWALAGAWGGAVGAHHFPAPRSPAVDWTVPVRVTPHPQHNRFMSIAAVMPEEPGDPAFGDLFASQMISKRRSVSVSICHTSSASYSGWRSWCATLRSLV